MKNDLRNMLNAIINGNDAQARTDFHQYITQVTSQKIVEGHADYQGEKLAISGTPKK
jgi:hypothetical protein